MEVISPSRNQSIKQYPNLTKAHKQENTSLDYLLESPSSNHHHHDLSIKADSPALKEASFTESSTSFAENTKKAKLANNLSKLMNQLRGIQYEKVKENPNKTFSSKNSLSPTDSTSPTNHKTAKERPQKQKPTELIMDSDRTVIKNSQNKYMQVIQSMRISHDTAGDGMSSRTESIRSPEKSKTKNTFLKRMTGKAPPEPPVKSLDLLTDLTQETLLVLIVALFQEQDLDPYIVDYFYQAPEQNRVQKLVNEYRDRGRRSFRTSHHQRGLQSNKPKVPNCGGLSPAVDPIDNDYWWSS